MTLVLGSAYGGAAYYALQDPLFRDTFTTYVPGGEQTLEFIEDLQKNNDIGKFSNQASDLKSQVEKYTKEYGTKIQESTNDAIHYATDAYQTLTGQKEPPKLPAFEQQQETPTKTTSIPPASDTKTTLHLSTDKEAQPVVVSVAIEKPDPIIYKPVLTKNKIVNELSQIVLELTTILNQAGLSGLGRTVIQDAQTKIEKLNDSFVTLDQEQAAILASLKALASKGNEIEGSLEKYHVESKQKLDKIQVDSAAAIVAREAQLKNQFEQTRAEMKSSFAEQLANDLKQQQERLEKARQDALLGQAQELQRRFVKQVKLLVEQERAGRLAKLDVIDKRFKALQEYALRNAEQLDASRQYHVMHVTLDALTDVVEQNKRQSFKNELQALTNNTKKDELIQTVLSVIPESVAQEGVETTSELSNRFELVSDEIRQVALVPEDGGFGSHIISYIMSYLMFKKQGLVDGDDVESVLARTEYYLKRDNLEFATRELNQLTGWPKRLAKDWMEAARRHLEVKQALEVKKKRLTSKITKLYSRLLKHRLFY